MANLLVIEDVRAIPDTVPSNGGTVSVQFKARTDPGNDTANVRYAVAAGLPFRVSEGGAANPQLTTTKSTVAQNVTISRTAPTTVSFIRIDVTASIPGDVTHNHPCFVSIAGTFGEHLSAFREENALTQRELADRFGVSRSTISRIENGLSPSGKLVQAIVEEIS